MWQAADSLLVLRDQVNVLAPNRSRASDGLVCDTNHPTSSDHCPHDVAGIGRDVVTALDLTHDPADGFDSFDFAETLRKNRDKRIKYVISNRRMFSSYATSSYPAWTWRPYTGSSDPHTNHVHISVLDAAISDTRTPWNLEGFDDVALTEADLNAIGLKVWNWDLLNGAPVGPAYEQILAILAQAQNNGGGITTLLTKPPVPVDIDALVAALVPPLVAELNTELGQMIADRVRAELDATRLAAG